MMSMQKRLRVALEADDEEQLLQLCGQLDQNLIVTAGGFNDSAVDEMSVTHHVAYKSYGVECLKVLVERLGPTCLKCRDKYNNTPVHCAALNQDEAAMQLIHKALGKNCFEVRGEYEQTAVHSAAMNSTSNSALKYLVQVCGPECLTVKDEDGDTPLHLAAWMQGSDSMELMKRELGAACFHQHGRFDRTAIHCAAMNQGSNDALKWLVNVCGKKCLTMTDRQGNTPIHLSAWMQTADSLQFIAGQLGTRVFWVKGFQSQTVAHSAAQNTNCNSALTWCVTHLGPACLLFKDVNGRTPAHLAAQHQGVDSLRLISDSLGVSAFELLKDAKGKTVADYAAMNSDRDRMLRWISKQRKQLQSAPAQQREQEEQKLQKFMRQLQLESQDAIKLLHAFDTV